MRLLMLVVAISMTPLTAHAQLVMVGAGAQSCGQWLEGHAVPEQSNSTLKNGMMISWVQGYLVGTAQTLTLMTTANTEPTLAQNQARFHTMSGWLFDPPDSAAVTHWVSKFCRDQPLKPLSDAAFALVNELATKTTR